MSNRSVKGALCITLQPLILSVISVPVTAYIVRSLGPLAFGQWSVAAALIATFTFLANLGLRGIFVRSVAQDPDSAPQALAEQLALRTLLSTIVVALALIACACLRYPPLVLLCTAISGVAFILTTASLTLGDLLQALHRLPALAAVNMVAGLLLTAASLLVVWVRPGPVELSISYLVGPVVSVALLWGLIHRRHFPVTLRWNMPRFLELLKNSRFLGFQQFTMAASVQAESLLIPKLVGITEYGFFSAGTLLATRLMYIPDGLGSAFYPSMAQAYQEAPETASRAVGRYMSLMLLICVPMAVLTTFLADPVAAILCPAQATVCRDVIRITIWSIPLAGINGMIIYALNAAGKDPEQIWPAIWGSACTVLLAVVLVWKMGLVGACWSFAARSAVLAVFRIPCYTRTYASVLRQIGVERILACGAIMAALMWFLSTAGSSAISTGVRLDTGSLQWAPALQWITLETAVGLTAYGIAVVVLGVVNKSELTRLLRRG